MRRLIVNADDLGYDPEIDRGIVEAHRRGIVTSTTAMIDAAFAAAALAALPPSLDVGLHVVLEATCPPDAVEGEVRRQLEAFRRVAGRAPTHLDSHKHVHALPALSEPFARAARRAGLPVRSIDGATRALLLGAGVRTCDAFLGDAALRPCWTAERLAAAIAAVGEGASELMCHPGYRPSHARTSFGAEREVELAALCDPSVRRAVEAGGVRLASWRDL